MIFIILNYSYSKEILISNIVKKLSYSYLCQITIKIFITKINYICTKNIGDV